MSEIVFFRSFEDREKYKKSIISNKTTPVTQKVKSKKQEIEEIVESKKDFFKNLKDNFINGEITRKKMIKNLKEFIEDNYKNNDKSF